MLCQYNIIFYFQENNQLLRSLELSVVVIENTSIMDWCKTTHHKKAGIKDYADRNGIELSATGTTNLYRGAKPYLKIKKLSNVCDSIVHKLSWIITVLYCNNYVTLSFQLFGQTLWARKLLSKMAAKWIGYTNTHSWSGSASDISFDRTPIVSYWHVFTFHIGFMLSLFPENRQLLSCRQTDTRIPAWAVEITTIPQHHPKSHKADVGISKGLHCHPQWWSNYELFQ